MRPESLENAVTRISVPLLQVSPTWVYIGKYTSKSYDVTGRSSGSTVGYTDFEIDAGWGSNSYDPTWHTYQWMIMLYYHREYTWSGYSPPVRNFGAWVIEPNSVVLDSRTTEYPDQRCSRVEPGGAGQGGEVSVTFSREGVSVTLSQSILPQVTWDGGIGYCHSVFYDGVVCCRGIWRWGVTSYDGSGQRNYYMAGLTTMEAINPLFFKVTFKANAYLAIRGIVDTASSGEHTIYFRADTTELRAVGES
jgi:hypothetical protein